MFFEQLTAGEGVLSRLAGIETLKSQSPLFFSAVTKAQAVTLVT